MVKAVPLWLKIATVVFIALIVIVMLAPLVVVVGTSFSANQFIAFPPKGFSLEWYQKVLSSSAYLSSGALSLGIALLVVAHKCQVRSRERCTLVMTGAVCSRLSLRLA